MFKNRTSVCLMISLLLLSGCVAIPQKTLYTKKTTFVLADGVEAQQTKGSISIILKTFNIEKEIRKPKYTQLYKVTYLPFLAPEVEVKDVALQTNIYTGTIVFDIEIINGTDHILRMKDSRVAYIDPDSDVPVMALDKASIYEDAEILPAYNQVKYYLENEERARNDVTVSIDKAFRKIVKKIKFVNGFNREILPGMRTKGIIVFPIDASDAAEGKVSFIDMVSKTDDAGNPVKRVRFDYRIKLITEYYKKVPGGVWVDISESEYKGRPR